MTEWKAKRFWKSATPTEVEGGFQVLLDARVLMTPGKQVLTLPTLAMAKAVAAEWDAQGEDIKPLTMPVTRGANSAIERVTPQHAEVADMLAAYAETDLLSHRATDPAALQDRQAAAWDPILDWAAATYGARLYATEGILAIAQPEDSLAIYRATLRDMTAFHLTALHDLITLSGSLLIGLAVSRGHLTPHEGWDLSRIDEEWQIAQWGRDEEADALAAQKRAQFVQAHVFWTLSDTN